MSLLIFWSVLFSSLWAGETNKKYAPQFILSSFNNQFFVNRFGATEIRLSQLIGYSSQKKIHKVVLVLGEEKTIEKDIKSLKKVYNKAKSKKIEFVYLVTPTSAEVSKTVRRYNPEFLVLKDPFQVVRNRYEFLKPQYCYVIDVHGKLESQVCSDIDDIYTIVR